VPTEISEELEALYARRAELERTAKEARAAGDDASLQITKLLLEQCDFLIVRAEDKCTDDKVIGRTWGPPTASNDSGS
jgi:hypothetical protein